MSDIFVFLLAFLIICVLSAEWPAIRNVATWLKWRSRTLEDVELGLVRIRVPAGWRQASFLNEQAAIQLVQPVQGRYLIVISDHIADLVAVDLPRYAAERIGDLTSELRLLSPLEPQDRTVAGFAAREVEFTGVYDAAVLTYLHTTIQGARGLHQIIGWAPRSRYVRAVFASIVDSFEELPGPVGEPVAWAGDCSSADGAPSSRRRIGF